MFEREARVKYSLCSSVVFEREARVKYSLCSSAKREFSIRHVVSVSCLEKVCLRILIENTTYGQRNVHLLVAVLTFADVKNSIDNRLGGIFVLKKLREEGLRIEISVARFGAGCFCCCCCLRVC